MAFSFNYLLNSWRDILAIIFVWTLPASKPQYAELQEKKYNNDNKTKEREKEREGRKKIWNQFNWKANGNAWLRFVDVASTIHTENEWQRERERESAKCLTILRFSLLIYWTHN